MTKVPSGGQFWSASFSPYLLFNKQTTNDQTILIGFYFVFLCRFVLRFQEVFWNFQIHTSGYKDAKYKQDWSCDIKFMYFLVFPCANPKLNPPWMWCWSLKSFPSFVVSPHSALEQNSSELHFCINSQECQSSSQSFYPITIYSRLPLQTGLTSQDKSPFLPPKWK